MKTAITLSLTAILVLYSICPAWAERGGSRKLPPITTTQTN